MTTLGANPPGLPARRYLCPRKRIVMAELSRAKKRELAKQIYLRDNLTLKEIADMVDVSQKSLSKWVKEEKWDTEKSAYTITREQQIQRIYGHISAINQAVSEREPPGNVPDAKEADTLNKLATAIKKLENEVGIAEVIGVCIKVCNHLRAKGKVEEARQASVWFNDYIKENI